MYPVSEAYKTAIAQNERNVKIAGTITLKDGTVIEISDEDIVQGSLYVSEQCVAGEDIEIGNVYASEMGLSLNSPPENPYALDGARIVLNFGIETSEGVWEYVPLGYFYVTEIERKTNMVNLKALDGMILFDTDLSGVLTTGTPYEMISSCCTKVGITLATDSATFSTFANGNMTFTLPADSKVQTCRDLIMWLCQLTGTFARMNRLGQLEIVPVKLGASVKTIDKQQRFTSDVSDSYVKITKVAMKVGDVEYSQGTDGMTMVLEENPLLVGKSETEINTALSNILNQVTTAEYIPYNVNFAGDPALQAGDYVTLTGIKVFDKIRATFTRSSVAYKSDGTQVAANQPRFEQGKFGKAIMVEEGTTNLFFNASFESGLTGWSVGTYGGTGEATASTAYAFCGTQSCLLSGGSSGAYIFQSVGSIGLAYSESFVVRKSDGGILTNSDVKAVLNNTVSNFDSITPLTNGWYLCSLNNRTLTNQIWGIWVAPGVSVYVDCAQMEQKPYATSFIDGTRAAETPTIPMAGVLNPQEGTIECWVYVPEFWKPGIPNWRRIWAIGRDAGAGMYVLHYDPGTGKIHFTIFNSSGVAQTISVDKPTVGWHFFAAKWSASEMALFIDGVKVGSIANPSLPSSFADTVISIGCRPDYPYDNVNTLIDDLRISSIARSDEEILAAYQSGQPLPVDEWTTLKLSFDDTLSGITTTGDSIITHSTWRYRGGHNIKAVGKSALVRGVQAQQTKSVSAVKTVAEAAREIAQAANQSTQLIQDAITGYVLIRKNETTGSNEILIMDNPDPAQARKVWRWNMGGLGYSDNVVGVDNPNRQYTIAITMDGAINADFIKTGILHSNIIGARSITVDKLQIGMTKTSSLYVRGTGLNRSANRIVRLDGVDIVNGQGRGLTLTILNRSDHSHVSSTNYDVFEDDTARTNLANALNALGDDKIVILTSWDAIRFNPTLEAAIERCGGGNVKDSYLAANARLPYVLIGIPGIGKGRGIEVFTSIDTNAPYAEVNTLIVDGTPVGINSGFTNATVVDGGQIITGSITADKLNVTSLSAISANLGTVTAGTLQGVNVIGGTIKTSNDANRLEMSSGSFKAYYNSVKRVELDYDSLDFYDTDARLTGHIYAISEVLPDYFTLPLLEMRSYGGIRLFAQQDGTNYAEINIWKPYAGEYDSHPGSVSIYTSNNNPDYGGVTGYGVFEVSPAGAMFDVKKVDIYSDVNIYAGYYGTGQLSVMTDIKQTDGINGFIIHSRFNAYDFWQLAPITNGSTEWNKGIALVRSTGNVGIGTTSPSEKLEIAGNVKATSFVQSSSIEGKAEITPLNDYFAYDKIKTLKIYEYVRIEDGIEGQKQIGVIAEEAPEEIVNSDRTGIDLYSYVSLIAKAVQDIQKKLEALEQQIGG